MLPAAAPPEPVADPEATAATPSVSNVDDSGLAPLVERRRDEHEEEDSDSTSTSSSSESSPGRLHPASICASAALVSLVHLLGSSACLTSLLLGATKHWARLPGFR